MNGRIESLALAVSMWLALAKLAAADPVGVVAVTVSDPLADSLGLAVCRAYVQFDDPSDNLLVVADAQVSANDPLGYYQHPFGGETAPLGVLCAFFPDLCLDSFVTIGLAVSDGTNSTFLTPAFDSCAFNCLPVPPCVPSSNAVPADCGELVGDWANSSPLNTQGHPDANLQVLGAQLTVRQGYAIAGQWTVFYNLGDVPFQTAFECFAACTTDASCDDGHACTADSCVDGACRSALVECDDDDACTLDGCEPVSGECVHPPADCSDGNPCTTDACDPNGVCSHAPIHCPAGQVCVEGECATACGAGADSCCGGHTTPGCEVVDCCQAVCAANPYCCESWWGEECIHQARIVCGDLCAGYGDGPVAGIMTVDKTSPEALSAGLKTCNVHLGFSEFENLFGVTGNITTDDPQGFYQHALGTDLAPNAELCAAFPLLCSDSFVTIGQKDAAADTTILGDEFLFISSAFNPPPPQDICVGPWLNGDPSNSNGLPDADMQVLIGQFTVRSNFNVAGGVIGWINGGFTPVGPFSFTCFDASGCVGDPDCDDLNACTADVCNSDGACSNGPLVCDDLDPCTADGCDPIVGCVYEPTACPAGQHCDSGECVPDALVFPLDIAPGKCPNRIKLGSGGKTKVIIVGDSDSHVNLIDFGSVRMRLCVGTAAISPDKPPRVKDKATPYEPQGCNTGCGCHKLKKDYVDDVEAVFRNSEIGSLDPALIDGQLVEVEVFGELLDGAPFVAHDCILVDRPGQPEGG